MRGTFREPTVGAAPMPAEATGSQVLVGGLGCASRSRPTRVGSSLVRPGLFSTSLQGQPSVPGWTAYSTEPIGSSLLRNLEVAVSGRKLRLCRWLDRKETCQPGGCGTVRFCPHYCPLGGSLPAEEERDETGSREKEKEVRGPRPFWSSLPNLLRTRPQSAR